MRVTAFILSILILVLSCLPCDDVVGMPIIKGSKSTEHNAPSHNHKESNELDLCSPFCHCSCCASFSVIYPAVVIPQRLEQTHSTPYTEYLSADLIEISLPIWQPPQLV